MKATTYSAMRGLSIIAMITFLFSYGLEAQEKVVIKERVEIAPKALRPGNSIKTIYLAYRIYTLQYPAEVSSIAYVYWDHITISQVNGDTVYHGFWPFTCNGIIMKFCSSMYYDDYESDEHPMYETGSGSASYGIFNAGTDLTFDLIYPEAHPLYVGEELNEEYPGTCGGYFRLYRDFDHDGSYGGTTYSIDIVRKDLTPPFTISFNDEHLGEITSVMYGEEVEIGIWLKDVCRRYYSVIPIPVSYRVMIISGSEWGYLYNQRTGQTGDTIDVSADDSWTTFKFLAIKQKPTQDQQVVLQAWSDHTSAPGTLEFTVKSSSCMSISISKPMIHPSERDTITLMQNTPEGIMPYPAYQMFDIWTNVDEKYGRLRCIATGEEGTFLTGTQPFEFIAADNIDVDSIVVAIQASVSTGGGGASSIGIGTKDTLRLSGSVMANKQSVVRNISALPSEMKRKNIELSINSLQARLNKVSARKGDEKQQQKLALDIEQLKAQLAYETAKTPAEKQNALASMKQMAMLAEETGECRGIDSIKIKKRTIKHFCQGDYPNVRYDNDVKKDKNGNIIKDKNGNPVYYSVARKGCALTCMAMIAYAGGANIDPGKLAEYMNNPTHHGFDGVKVNWPVINNLNNNTGYRYNSYEGDGLQYNDDETVDLDNSTNADVTHMDQYLNEGALIIAQVYNPSTNGNHWVLVTDKDNNGYSIIDPGCYSGRDNLSAYGNIYRFIVYTKSN